MIRRPLHVPGFRVLVCLTVTNSTISGNSAAGAGGGGGIATQGQAIVVNSAVTGNAAVDHGGGSPSAPLSAPCPGCWL